MVKLRPKQARFVKAYLENGGNGTQAVLQSYDTTDLRTATSIGVENLAKPGIREVVEQAMAKNGLTPETLTDNIKHAALAKPDKVSADAMIKANVELLKLWGAYPGSKHTNLNLSVRGKIKDLTFQDAKRALEKLNSKLGEIVEPEEPTT